MVGIKRCRDFGLERVAAIAHVALARPQGQPAGLALVHGPPVLGGESFAVVRRLATHVVEGQFPALLAQAYAVERDTAADPRRGGALVLRLVAPEPCLGLSPAVEVFLRFSPCLPLPSF